MKRREFLKLVLPGAIAWPHLVQAQQAAKPIIGYLDSGSADRNWAEAFRHGLNKTGYVEGKNVTIEYRWADGKYDRLPMLAADLVQRNVAVIAATSTPPALAAQKATSTIPIVFTTGSDPVRFGLVANLSHPGGNVTGVTRLNLALEAKRLQLLHELLPSAHTIALLVNPTNPNSKIITSDVQAEGNSLGVNVEIVRATTESDIDQVFATLHQASVDALLIGPDPFFNSRSQLIAKLMLRYAVPTMFQYQEYVEAGGLLSYSASLTDSHRQVGVYVGKILAGAKASDLPVEQSTRLELIINLKTAKALNLSVPPSILVRADKVIE